MFPTIASKPRFQQTTLYQIAKLATLRIPSLTQSPFLHDLDMLRIESVVVLPEHFFHREHQIHRIHELRILSIPHPSTHHAASGSKLDMQQTASSRKANVCLQRGGKLSVLVKTGQKIQKERAVNGQGMRNGSS